MSNKKLVLYVMKVKDSNSNIRFTLKATYPDSGFKLRSEELKQPAGIIGDHERQEEQDILANEFNVFIMKALDEYELYLVDNQRANLTIKFGDEYSMYSSVSAYMEKGGPGQLNSVNFKFNSSIITLPIEKHEIEFFWECLSGIRPARK